MKVASHLQTNLDVVFDNGIQEGEIHGLIRRQVFSQCGKVCDERGKYHRCEERDMRKRHLLLDIYVNESWMDES